MVFPYRVGVVRMLAFSEGVAGLLGLLTHAASFGGPWALVGFRVVQGAVQVSRLSHLHQAGFTGLLWYLLFTFDRRGFKDYLERAILGLL